MFLTFKTNTDKDTKVEKVTSVQSVAVVLENVDSMSRDLLSMLVENISGLEDSAYSLEIIWETNRAVITFNSPAGRKEHKTSFTTSRPGPRWVSLKQTDSFLKAGSHRQKHLCCHIVGIDLIYS